MNLQEQKVLITGATGSVGKQLVYCLTRRDIRPIVHCRQSSDTGYLDSHGLEKRYADLRNQDELNELVKGIDGIIHTAALVNFRQDRLTHFTGINTFGAVDLYKAARKAGVKRFVHISTVGAVGAVPRTNNNVYQVSRERMDEQSEFNLGHLRIPYIMTKHAAEKELFALAGEGGPELVIVNPSIIVCPSRTGDDWREARKSFNSIVMPDFPNTINLVDLRDVAPAIVAALEKGRAGERYILAGDNIVARDLMLAVSEVLGKSPHLLRLHKAIIRFAARFSVTFCKLTGKGKISFYPDLVRLADYDWAYSSMKARKELGFKSRSIYITLSDLLHNDFVGSWQKPTANGTHH